MLCIKLTKRPENRGRELTVREVDGREGENHNANQLFVSRCPDRRNAFCSPGGAAGLASHMYSETKLIDQAIGDFEKYASARQEAQQLKRTLGL